METLGIEPSYAFQSISYGPNGVETIHKRKNISMGFRVMANGEELISLVMTYGTKI